MTSMIAAWPGRRWNCLQLLKIIPNAFVNGGVAAALWSSTPTASQLAQWTAMIGLAEAITSSSLSLRTDVFPITESPLLALNLYLIQVAPDEPHKQLQVVIHLNTTEYLIAHLQHINTNIYLSAFSF